MAVQGVRPRTEPGLQILWPPCSRAKARVAPRLRQAGPAVRAIFPPDPLRWRGFAETPFRPRPYHVSPWSQDDLKARFATTAAANGERVIITKHGKPFVEIVAVKPPVDDLWARLDAARDKAGIEPGDLRLDDEWLKAFNDPAFSRRVLSLED